MKAQMQVLSPDKRWRVTLERLFLCVWIDERLTQAFPLGSLLNAAWTRKEKTHTGKWQKQFKYAFVGLCFTPNQKALQYVNYEWNSGLQQSTATCIESMHGCQIVVAYISNISFLRINPSSTW